MQCKVSTIGKTIHNKGSIHEYVARRQSAGELICGRGLRRDPPPTWTSAARREKSAICGVLGGNERGIVDTRCKETGGVFATRRGRARYSVYNPIKQNARRVFGGLTENERGIVDTRCKETGGVFGGNERGTVNFRCKETGGVGHILLEERREGLFCVGEVLFGVEHVVGTADVGGSNPSQDAGPDERHAWHPRHGLWTTFEPCSRGSGPARPMDTAKPL
jgi:hypothetical protein